MALPSRRAAWIAACAALPPVAAAPAAASASTAPIVRLAGTGTSAAWTSTNPPDLMRPALGTPFTYAGALFSNEGNHTVLVGDPPDHRILRVDDNGHIHVFAGSGSGTASNGSSRFEAGIPNATAITSTGLEEYRVIAFDNGGAKLRAFSTFGGGGIDNGVALSLGPRDLSTYNLSKVYIPFEEQLTIGVVEGTTFTTVAGNGTTGSPPPADDPLGGSIGAPLDVAADQSADGTLIFSTTAGKVWRVTGAGTAGDAIAVVAGGGSSGLGDNGSPTSAELVNPQGLVMLADGGFLVYDAGHSRIRRVSGMDPSTATITTIAGNGTDGLAASGTPANLAAFGASGFNIWRAADMVLTPDGLVISQGPAAVIEMIPATAITSGPPAMTLSRTAEFTLASWDDEATFECTLDSGTPGPCQTYTNLSEGNHRLEVKATTDNGTRPDYVPAVYDWTVDSKAPAPFDLVDPGDGAQVGAASFSWKETTDEGPGDVHYEVWIDGAKAGDNGITCGGVCTTFVNGPLPDGMHTWKVRATDDTGNVTESATRTFKLFQPPMSFLAIAPERALVGRPVSFDASMSSDFNGTIADFSWDLDGDGTFETDTGTKATTTKTYSVPQTLTIKVKVSDNAGGSTIAVGTLVITAPPPAGKDLGVSINDGAQYTNDPNVTVFSVWPAFASNMKVSNDGGFKLGEVFPVAEKTKWKLDSSGPERLPKTIYVRFTGGLQTSETFQDDIILDQTPPKVLAATLAAPASASAARAAKAKLVKLKLKARDNVSGVGRVQVTANKRKPGKLLRYKKTLKVKSAPRLFVRVRDKAGNFSRWRKATRR